MSKKKTKCLIVIDMQNDFISGSLGTKEAEAIVPKVLEKLKTFDGRYVIFTRDTHSDDYLFTKEGQKLPVKHCIKGTKGWQLQNDIQEWYNENHLSNDRKVAFIVDKPTFACVDKYGEASLSNLIDKFIEFDESDECEIEIIGLCTDICVVSNALYLKNYFYHNAEVSVDSSCCAGVTPDKHNAALEIMRSCQINVN